MVSLFVENCIFCSIITGKIPSTIIAQNEHLVVIKDIKPQAPVHYLIIPKKHGADLYAYNNADKELLGEMLLMAQQLGTQLPEPKAFRLSINNGAAAGQVVFHLHMHFLAGRAGSF